MARGFSRSEIEQAMGGAIPSDPAQRDAYCALLIDVLREIDEHRFDAAFLLGCVPEEICSAWDALAHRASLDSGRSPAHAAATN